MEFPVEKISNPEHEIVRMQIPPNVLADLRTIYQKHSGKSKNPFQFSYLFEVVQEGAMSEVVEERLVDEGIIIPSSVKEFFSTAYQNIRGAGFDGGIKDMAMRTAYVAADPGILPGVCVQKLFDGGGQGDKFFERAVVGENRQSDSQTLFLYDMRKLDRLSKEEADASLMFAAGYGVKPKPDETFESAEIAELKL